MPPLRPARRHQPARPAIRYLLILATLLSLILTPFGNAIAAPFNDDDQPQVVQDPAELPQGKSPNDPPRDTKPTEPVETKEPESAETKEPPAETKEPPATEPTTSEALPTQEAKPTEPVEHKKPAPSESAPSEPPGSGGPSPLFTGTLIVIKGVCDDPAYAPYDAASLAELLANCTPYSTDATFTYTYSDSGATLTQATSGSSTSFDVLPGGFSLQEELPPGYLSPVVGCESAMIGDTIVFMPGNGETINFHIDSGDTLTCYWLNIPIPPTFITVIKGLCDDISFDPYTASHAELAANCTQASGDATFTYQQTHTGGPNELTLTQTTSGSSTAFEVPPGNFEIQESIPTGFGEPVVSCHLDQFNVEILPEVIAGAIVGHIDLGHTRTCHWYNVPLGSDSHLLISKWQCPAGYDLGAPAANPARDCTQRLDGVEFALEGNDNGSFASATTGDDAPGVAAFPDLEPGEYTITEMLPDGFDAAFVWTCTTAGMVASPTTPLSTGVTLTVTTIAGWNTICHWFNVTELTPPGSLTVIKYSCLPTPSWILPRCLIHRTGQEFDLLQWTGDTWVSAGTGTTGRDGRHTWANLPPGTYALEEVGRDWCRISSHTMTPGDKAITVEPGAETIVHVYNCTTKRTPIRDITPFPVFPRVIWTPAP